METFSGEPHRIWELMGAAESSCRYASRRKLEELRRKLVEAPEALRCDNGPEFTPRHILGWALERKIELVHIEPGRPMQNGYVESFHGKLRDECLNASWFGNLFEARVKIGAWKGKYNEERPHRSVGYVAPREFARRIAALPPQFGEPNEAQVISSGVSGVLRSRARS